MFACPRPPKILITLESSSQGLRRTTVLLANTQLTVCDDDKAIMSKFLLGLSFLFLLRPLFILILVIARSCAFLFSHVCVSYFYLYIFLFFLFIYERLTHGTDHIFSDTLLQKMITHWTVSFFTENQTKMCVGSFIISFLLTYISINIILYSV